MTTAFCVRLKFVDGDAHSIEYESIAACLEDSVLKNVFDDALVEACSIYCDDVKIAGLPTMTWNRFADQIVDNAKAILKRVRDKDATQG